MLISLHNHCGINPSCFTSNQIDTPENPTQNHFNNMGTCFPCITRSPGHGSPGLFIQRLSDISKDSDSCLFCLAALSSCLILKGARWLLQFWITPSPSTSRGRKGIDLVLLRSSSEVPSLLIIRAGPHGLAVPNYWQGAEDHCDQFRLIRIYLSKIVT